MSRFQFNAFRDRRAVAVLAMITLGIVVMPMLELMHGPQLVLTTKATDVLAAINERRKKIHAIEDLGPIDDQDGFFVFTLMEIAMRSSSLTKRS